jgi:hypothetical protein
MSSAPGSSDGVNSNRAAGVYPPTRTEGIGVIFAASFRPSCSM